MSYTLVSHPLLQAKLSHLRDARTPASRFRGLVKEISTILGIEASRNHLQLQDVDGVRGVRIDVAVALELVGGASVAIRPSAGVPPY